LALIVCLVVVAMTSTATWSLKKWVRPSDGMNSELTSAFNPVGAPPSVVIESPASGSIRVREVDDVHTVLLLLEVLRLGGACQDERRRNGQRDGLDGHVHPLDR
jgi:hypothetical protein